MNIFFLYSVALLLALAGFYSAAVIALVTAFIYNALHLVGALFDVGIALDDALNKR